MGDLCSVADPFREPWSGNSTIETLDAVAAGSAVRQGFDFELPDEEDTDTADPRATAPQINTSALPSHDPAAWTSRKRQRHPFRRIRSSLGPIQRVPGFVRLRSASAHMRRAHCVCARACSLLNQEAAEAQVSIAMQVVADAAAAAVGALAASTLLLESSAEFTLESSSSPFLTARRVLAQYRTPNFYPLAVARCSLERKA